MLFLFAFVACGREKTENRLLELLDQMNDKNFVYVTSRDDTPGAKYRRVERRAPGAARLHRRVPHSARKAIDKFMFARVIGDKGKGMKEFDRLLEKLGAEDLVRILLESERE